MEYEEFVMTVRRDINCLSGDRNLKRNALVRLDGIVKGGNISDEVLCRLFVEELHRPLFRLFGDASEKCRELSLSMTRRFIDVVPLESLANLLPLLLSALLGRFRPLPFPEQSEELRLESLQLLGVLFDLCTVRLAPFAGDIVDAISKALSDTCPDAKKECCKLVKKVVSCCEADRVGCACAPLVASLLANARHQHWKVRWATVDCLGPLLAIEPVMLDQMDEAFPQLNILQSDRATAVRSSVAECVERWLLEGLRFRAPLVLTFDDDLGLAGFDKLEHRLVLLLLSSVADDEVQVATQALGGLERVAISKQDARLKRRRLEVEKARAAATAAAALKGNPEEIIDDTGEAEIVVDLPAAFDYDQVKSLLTPPFLPGPSILATALVELSLPVILPQVLGNLIQWTTEIRGSAARLLRVILVLANERITPFLDQVLVHLYKASADDDLVVARGVLGCAEILGAMVDSGLLLRLVGQHLGLDVDGGVVCTRSHGVEEVWHESRVGRATTRTVQDTSANVKAFAATSSENRKLVLRVLAHLVPGAALQPCDVSTLTRFLEEGAQTDDLLPSVLTNVQAILERGGCNCCPEWSRIFDLLLRMRSSSCDVDVVDRSMDHLASLCGRSRQELYTQHLRTRLGELLYNGEKEFWDERSPKRQILETLLKHAASSVPEHMGALVPVFSKQASPEAPSSARIDILGMIHFLITQGDAAMAVAVQAHAAALLEDVLIPNCVWRAGQTNNRIRKGSMVCVHALLQQHLVEPDILNAAFATLLPTLKSCLDDSWSPDNRHIGCLVLACLMDELRAQINGEQLREIYPELLKRLDDSHDEIRTVVCGALVTFFKCLPPNWSRSLYEYILKSLFVHLDDPNPDLQRSMHAVLETAVHQDCVVFAQEARAAVSKSAHPRICEELLRLADSLQADVVMN